MKKILFVSAAALLMWACSSEETTPVEEETIEEEVEATTTGRISIFPVFTKATDDTFEDGDQIGITICKTDASSNYVTNQPLTYSASDGTFTGDVTWYSGSETCTITAYYPYQTTNMQGTAGIPLTFNLATDQTEGTSSSDLIGAYVTEVSPSSEAVGIEFNHLLSRINVKVSTGTMISSVKLSGAYVMAVPAVYNSVMYANPGGSTSEVTLYPATDNELYQAIVAPATVTLTLSLTTTGGTTVTKELSEKTLAGGTEYDLNVSYPYINGYKYVDLGLPSGLLWATYNVGAENSLETDYGSYYAWGETGTKDLYYSDSNTYNTSIADFSGNSTYDAATYNWESPWRMPTYDEFSELVNTDNVSWSSTTVNDVSGRLGTSKADGNTNTIFFPYAGGEYCLDGSTSRDLNKGSSGLYWTSTPYSTTKAYYGNFTSSKVSVAYSYNRYYGFPVRPVADAGVYDD